MQTKTEKSGYILRSQTPGREVGDGILLFLQSSKLRC